MYIYSYLLLSYQISKNMIFNESTKPIKKKGGGGQNNPKKKKNGNDKNICAFNAFIPTHDQSKNMIINN